MDDDAEIPPEPTSNDSEGGGDEVVDNDDLNDAEEDSPPVKIPAPESPAAEGKMEEPENSETEDSSPFKAPPMAFKLPGFLPKNPKLFDGIKNKSESREKATESKKIDDSEISNDKNNEEKKVSDAVLISGPKRKSAVAALTPAQKVFLDAREIFYTITTLNIGPPSYHQCPFVAEKV